MLSFIRRIKSKNKTKEIGASNWFALELRAKGQFISNEYNKHWTMAFIYPNRAVIVEKCDEEKKKYSINDDYFWNDRTKKDFSFPFFFCFLIRGLLLKILANATIIWHVSKIKPKFLKHQKMDLNSRKKIIICTLKIVMKCSAVRDPAISNKIYYITRYPQTSLCDNREKKSTLYSYSCLLLLLLLWHCEAITFIKNCCMASLQFRFVFLIFKSLNNFFSSFSM